MRGYINSARAQLAIAFPPQHGLRGAMTTLADLCRPEYQRPHFFTRLECARLVLARNSEVFEPGQGRRAWRRVLNRLDELGDSIKALERRIARNRRQWAADEAAERRSEARTYRRTADVINPHDD